MSDDDGGLGDGATGRDHDITTLVDRLQGTFDRERHEAAFELVASSAERPDAVAAHVPELLELCTTDGPAAEWAAAAAVGNVAQRAPDAVAPHVRLLLEAFGAGGDEDRTQAAGSAGEGGERSEESEGDKVGEGRGAAGELEAVRESLSSALVHLVSTVEVPTEPLLSSLEAGGPAASKAVNVLAAVATTEPSRLSVDRLDRLTGATDETVRTGARFLLTLLAAQGQCDPPYAPTPAGFERFAMQHVEGFPDGESNAFVSRTLRERAIDEFLAPKLEPAGYHGMKLVVTPEESQLTLHVESPGRVIGKDGKNIRKLADVVESRFGLEELTPRVQSVEETAEAEPGDEDAVDQAASEPPAERGPPESIPSAPHVELSYGDLKREERLGIGGNAAVYRASARTPDGDLPVALKVPRTEGTLHAETVDRLLDEAETWQHLDDHDHVVGVVDYGVEPLPWIAMEYMDGGHLGERAGELSFEQALWTAIAIVEAVFHAHRRGVAHLDLKPENVLFRTVEGAWDVPKVADWGLSKRLLERSASGEGLSPQYAAPEQFDDAYGPTDNVTDIYQLGVMFYELFTGEPPFADPTAAIPEGSDAASPTPPGEHADLPAALDGILRTALATERADRYEDIVYLRDDLRALADG